MDAALTPVAEAAIGLDRTNTGGVGIRAVGRVIDTIATYANAFLFGMLAAVVLVVLDAARMIEPGWESRIDGNLFATIVLGIFNSIVAGTVTESIAGTSLGKLILGYRVVSLEPLEPCRPRAALIRSAAYFIDSLFFGIIAIIAMQDSTLHQRMGDSWAGTAVAKSSALPPEAKRGFGLVALGILAGFVVSGLLTAAPMFLRGIL